MPTDSAPANRQAILLHGQDVVVKQYTFGSATGNYEEKPRNITGSNSVTAIVNRSGGDITRAPDGVARSRSIGLTVPGDVTVSDSEPASRFEVDDVDYEVEFADDQDNGVISVAARRIDED